MSNTVWTPENGWHDGPKVSNDEVFSRFANSVVGATITAYSSREGIHMILPGTGRDALGNHTFEPCRKGPVTDYLLECVAELIQLERVIGRNRARRESYINPEFARGPRMTPDNGYGLGSWVDRGYSLNIRPDWSQRGKYVITVWTPKVK